MAHTDHEHPRARRLNVMLMAPVACAAPGLAVAAQTPPDAEAHKAWMNDATDQQDELREALVAKSGAKAAAAATKLAALMGKTESYWSRKRAAEIVKLAQQSRSLAAQVAASARAGKFDRARAAFDTMNATCNTCHNLHPEKR